MKSHPHFEMQVKQDGNKSWDLKKKKSVPVNSGMSMSIREYPSFLVQMQTDPAALESILSLLAEE